MKMRLPGVIGFAVLMSTLITPLAMATSFVYTDNAKPWSSNGNTIYYTLTVNLDSSNHTGTASFVIDTTADTRPPSYYAVEFDFKLTSGNNTPAIDLSGTPVSTGPWQVLDNDSSNTKIWKDNKGFNTISGGAAGFVVQNILYSNGSNPPSVADYEKGILLNGYPPMSYTFNFDFDLGSNTFRTDGIVPYQSIIFATEGSSIAFGGQLSVELGGTTHAPEPGSLILLGTGLAALGAYSWRRKR